MSEIAIRRREHRLRRHRHVRKKVAGTVSRPRLAVYRSLQHIYCQIIDDDRGHTLCAASSRELEKAGALVAGKGGAMAGAEAVGAEIARRAKEAGISTVAFDRGGFRYHGRVRALAESARKAGLEF